MDVTGHNMRMSGGKMHATCDHLYAREKSGYIINDLTGSCEVGLGKALVEDIHIIDPWSDIRLDYYSMTYPWAIAFKNFIGEVKLEAEMQPTRLALQTLTYFTGAFNGAPTLFDIRRGHVVGYINDFRVDRLAFTEAATGVSTTVDGTCVGLPDINKMLLDVRVQDLKATTDGLGTVIAGLAPGFHADLGRFARDLPMTLHLPPRVRWTGWPSRANSPRRRARPPSTETSATCSTPAGRWKPPPV